ncbi:unnamed protein product [Triticum turgidum subsp. durum]|uniref:ATP synthase F1 complex delta/epsilon subunit N-terminal domain-containing protein n=1 Tax=Triticum turgidum subsp. durum TaxID=4567 RepID=A0A9R0XIG1_TRITD|nr:unnamed protein product [Triticum turgidum subsp. durum]
MKLNLYVLTPKRIIWDCEVKEIILSTNSGQIGVLPNHAPKVLPCKGKDLTPRYAPTSTHETSYDVFPNWDVEE